MVTCVTNQIQYPSTRVEGPIFTHHHISPKTCEKSKKPRKVSNSWDRPEKNKKIIPRKFGTGRKNTILTVENGIFYKSGFKSQFLPKKSFWSLFSAFFFCRKKNFFWPKNQFGHFLVLKNNFSHFTFFYFYSIMDAGPRRLEVLQYKGHVRLW